MSDDIIYDYRIDLANPRIVSLNDQLELYIVYK